MILALCVTAFMRQQAGGMIILMVKAELVVWSCAVMHHHLPGRVLRLVLLGAVCSPALGICRQSSGVDCPTRAVRPVTGS
jgi:hypothetical protein